VTWCTGIDDAPYAILIYGHSGLGYDTGYNGIHTWSQAIVPHILML
jgi:hypothetical protein